MTTNLLFSSELFGGFEVPDVKISMFPQGGTKAELIHHGVTCLLETLKINGFLNLYNIARGRKYCIHVDLSVITEFGDINDVSHIYICDHNCEGHD